MNKIIVLWKKILVLPNIIITLCVIIIGYGTLGLIKNEDEYSKVFEGLGLIPNDIDDVCYYCEWSYINTYSYTSNCT